MAFGANVTAQINVKIEAEASFDHVGTPEAICHSTAGSSRYPPTIEIETAKAGRTSMNNAADTRIHPNNATGTVGLKGLLLADARVQGSTIRPHPPRDMEYRIDADETRRSSMVPSAETR